jgi:hypothetical protein
MMSRSVVAKGVRHITYDPFTSGQKLLARVTSKKEQGHPQLDQTPLIMQPRRRTLTERRWVNTNGIATTTSAVRPQSNRLRARV